MPAPDPAHFDRFFRLLICGSAGCGKKTLMQSFCTDGDGVDTWTTFGLDGEKILVSAHVSRMWRKEFGAEFDAIAVVFATDDVFSFEYALELMNEAATSAPQLPLVVVENKMDVVESTEVDKVTVESAMHQRHKRLYRFGDIGIANRLYCLLHSGYGKTIRVSALKEFNVMHPFAYLLEKLTRSDKDENANERKASPVECIRLPSREGWPEIPSLHKKVNKDRCAIM